MRARRSLSLVELMAIVATIAVFCWASRKIGDAWLDYTKPHRIEVVGPDGRTTLIRATFAEWLADYNARSAERSRKSAVKTGN